MAASAHARIAKLAAMGGTHRAFSRLHLQQQRVDQLHKELVGIPAPPFLEEKRAHWFVERFREIGLKAPHLDDAGNALAYLREPSASEPLLLVSAHLDTVFPPDTAITLVEDGKIFRAPGACDNGAGLAALLALAAALRNAEVFTDTNLLFAANVGEEAEGDLRGMRQIFQRSPLGYRIIASIALEGAGLETVVSRALGSRRFRITITGPGGHSWTDAGTVNPVEALAAAIVAFTSAQIPVQPRTSINIGQIEGGTSVTSIPECASALVDIRSTDAQEMLVQEVRLHRAVEDAVLDRNRAAGSRGLLRYRIETIGNRPAGELKRDSALLATVRAVDRHLGLRTEDRIGSTDANIPISLGREGIAIGAGGTAGGIHTLSEWYDTTGRELALRRILLCILDAASCSFPARLAHEDAPENTSAQAWTQP